MAKHIREISFVLVLAVCLLVLFSAVFITAEADHDCIGEDCRICAVITICKNTLKMQSAVAADAVVSAALAFASIAVCVCIYRSDDKNSLVSLKVKLSN